MGEIRVLEAVDTLIGREWKVGAVGEGEVCQSKGCFTLTEMRLGRAYVKCLLAAGIATPVQYRRGGNVRRMFEVMHETAAREGAVLALLHPFSFSYYRKFGYERVADHRILRMPLRLLDFVPRRCGFRPYEDSMLDGMIKVYDAFTEGRNLLLRRADARHFTRKGQSTFVCTDEAGQVCAYVVLSFAQRLDVNHYVDGLLTVHEMAFSTPEGLREICSFLRMYEGEYDEVEFANIAMIPELELLLSHETHTFCRILPDLMARVLDTARLLEGMSYPTAAGRFRVSVRDDLPCVGGCFEVSYGNGVAEVTRLSSDVEVDLTLSSGALIRLVCGYDGVDARAAAYRSDLRLHNACEDFFRAFPKRPCGVFEHF